VFSAYTLTNTVKLGTYFKVRDSDILIHNGIEFNNYLNSITNYNAEQSKMLEIFLRSQLLIDFFFHVKIQVR